MGRQIDRQNNTRKQETYRQVERTVDRKTEWEKMKEGYGNIKIDRQMKMIGRQINTQQIDRSMDEQMERR